VREQKVKRKKERKKEDPKTPTTKSSDKLRKQQHIQRLLAPQLKGQLCLMSQTHVASEAEILIPYSED